MKLRAVTLMELLVVMLVSSIVIAVCYFAYLIAYHQMGDYKKTSTEVNKSLLLHTILQSDFSESRKAIKINNGILFTFEKDKRHEYHFDSNYILRTEKERTDTFKIQAMNLQYLFQFRQQNKTDSLIDEFIFEAQVLEKQRQFHYTKEYDTYTLIKF